MKKLEDLAVLERIVEEYNGLSLNHRLIIYHFGACFDEMVEDINVTLSRLLVSKTKQTCRNVLLANFDTMTKTSHWLNCKLFNDLPKEKSIKLQKKVEEMVNLMNALVLKIIRVDSDYAERFFKRLKERYNKINVYEYDLWKAQLPKLTIKLILEFQAELTAKMLIMGILKYDRMPSDEEMEGVRLDLLKKKLRHDMQLPEYFPAECAKLRRYSHWEGELFIVDYPMIRDYLFKVFGKLTKEQHIAIFEYDAQMKAIHKDLKDLIEASKKSTEVLFSDKAMKYWQRLEEQGFVDQSYMLMPDTTRQQAMLIAEPFAEKLGLKSKWKPFEDHWGIKNLAQEKYELQQTGLMPPRFRDIGVIFED